MEEGFKFFYRTKKLTSLGAKIWKILLNDHKGLASLSTFKSKIKNWGTNALAEYPKRISNKMVLFDWHCYVRLMCFKH